MTSKPINSDEIVHSLTLNPDKILTVAYSLAQDKEVHKARARLHRQTGGFLISASRVRDDLHIWRVPAKVPPDA